MTIIQAIRDPNLFKPFFRDMATWESWFVVLKSIFGLPMNDEEVAAFQQLTNRVTPPKEQTK